MCSRKMGYNIRRSYDSGSRKQYFLLKIERRKVPGSLPNSSSYRYVTSRGKYSVRDLKLTLRSYDSGSRKQYFLLKIGEKFQGHCRIGSLTGMSLQEQSIQ